MMKDIEGYEGLYAVTEDGKVWSYRKGSYLKPTKYLKFYAAVNLYKDKIMKRVAVHRLVATAFIPNTNNLPCVCHKVESLVLDNAVNNLWWGTKRDNAVDMVKKGRHWNQTRSFEEIQQARDEISLRQTQRQDKREEQLRKVKEHLELQKQLEILYKFDSLKSKDVKEIIVNLKNYYGLLTDVAKIFGVSRERIRQIRNRK